MVGSGGTCSGDETLEVGRNKGFSRINSALLGPREQKGAWAAGADNKRAQAGGSNSRGLLLPVWRWEVRDQSARWLGSVEAPCWLKDSLLARLSSVSSLSPSSYKATSSIVGPHPSDLI